MLNITNHQRNGDPNHNEVLPHTHMRMTAIKNQKIASVCKDVEKLVPLCTVGEIVKSCNCYKNSMEAPQKI